MTTTTTKERPILFSAPMVRALLEGRKTQTRRIVKPQPRHVQTLRNGVVEASNDGGFDNDVQILRCPYGEPGDRLWVKETHALLYQKSDCPVIAYRADDSARVVFTPPEGNFTLAGQAGEAASTWRAENIRWRPSIHMPRWASRLTLEITDVRVQRVEAISDEDAFAEGIQSYVDHGGARGTTDATARATFLHLFYDINKRAKRGTNPWVWVIAFKVAK